MNVRQVLTRLGPILGLLFVPPALADVSPQTVNATLQPGETLDVTKSVTLPEVPPKLDLVMLVDLSGSYTDDLPNLKSLAPGIFSDIRARIADSRFGLATFVDYPFSPWGDAGDYAYRLDQALTTDRTAWTAAVNAMATRSGADAPESQYEALFQLARGTGREMPPTRDGDFTDPGEIPPGLAAAFRPDATKVVAITTDAPFHVAGDAGPFSYPGPTAAEATAALVARGIKVIAIKAPGAGAEMDALAAATGGAVVTTGSSSAEIARAILEGVESLRFDVRGRTRDCPTLEVSFDPPVRTGVSGGDTVTFRERIRVPPGASGDLRCTVEFLAGDTVIGTEQIAVRVNRPPDCSAATAQPGELWPPNHRLAGVTIRGVRDLDGDPVRIAVTSITQDEPVLGTGSGDTCPDATGVGTASPSVRVERAGGGNGRVYHLRFTATDQPGATCSGVVTVCVPHDQGPGPACVDDGALHSSTTCP